MPFLVVAWQRLERGAGAGAAADGGRFSPGDAGEAPGIGSVGAGCLTAAGTGGRQFAQGPYLAAASASGISILLLRRELHDSRWYFVPVRVT